MKDKIIIDGNAYFEVRKTPLHIEYEHTEVWTDKDGKERTSVLVHIEPRNFIGKIADWIEDTECFHPVRFYGVGEIVIVAVLAFLIWLSVQLIKYYAVLDFFSVLVYALTVAYATVMIIWGKMLIEAIIDWWKYDYLPHRKNRKSAKAES